MKKYRLRPWILLFPCLLIMVTTVLYPIFRTFLFSLHNYKMTEPYNRKFVGINNYLKVLGSQDFHSALKNSLIILVLTLVIAFSFSIVVGLILNKKSKISPILTAVAIIPWALPPLVNGIIWKFVFYPGYGFMNKLLINMGLVENPIEWTSGITTTLFVVAIVVAWKVIPFCSILILASLQNIPKELYEAARVDGCGKIDEFKKITLPFLLPSFSIVLIQITIAAINVFDELVSITGYRLDTATLLIYNYMNTFTYLDFGYGSAITYIVMILSGLVGYLYIKNIAKED